MNFMKFEFIFEFFLLRCKKICTQKLIVTLDFSLLRHGICFQSFFHSFCKVDLHSTNVSRMTDTIQMVFLLISILGKQNVLFTKVTG